MEPSEIAQFVEHDRCPRYLKQRVDPGEEPEARDWQEAFGLMNIALLGKGKEFEADQLEGLATDAAQIIAPELDDRTKTGMPDISVDETWADSPRGRTAQLTAAVEHLATLNTSTEEFGNDWMPLSDDRCAGWRNNDGADPGELMEPIRTDGGLHVAGDERSTGEHAIVASLKQLFTGLRVGLPSLTVQCCGCGAQLGDSDQVSVYAYRTVETPRWHLAHYRCTECPPDDIATPTLGATEARISARLGVVSDGGTQQHRLCLVEPTVKIISSPQDGTPP